MAQDTCSIEGCDRPIKIKARRLCNLHYRRFQRHGNPLAGGPPKAPDHGDRICAISGCDRPEARREWCEMHYLRWRRTGDPLCVRPPASVDVSNGKVCKTCGERKPVDEFYMQKRPNGKKYAQSRCKRCVCAAMAARRNADPETDRARSRAYKAANPEIIRREIARRRALLLAAWVEHVDRVKVYARDIGRCGICGGIVDRRDFHVDHIIPLNRGGDHSYANVQLAHPSCNVAKGDRLPEELEAMLAA